MYGLHTGGTKNSVCISPSWVLGLICIATDFASRFVSVIRKFSVSNFAWEIAMCAYLNVVTTIIISYVCMYVDGKSISCYMHVFIMVFMYVHMCVPSKASFGC